MIRPLLTVMQGSMVLKTFFLVRLIVRLVLIRADRWL